MPSKKEYDRILIGAFDWTSGDERFVEMHIPDTAYIMENIEMKIELRQREETTESTEAKRTEVPEVFRKAFEEEQ